MNAYLRILLATALGAAISYACFAQGLSVTATTLTTITLVVIVRCAIALTIDKEDLP